MADQGRNRTGRIGWGFKVLLGLSLALNLAVTGIIVGGIVRQGGWSERNARMPALGSFGAPYMQALPREERRKILETVRGQADVDIPDRKARRAMFARVLNALRGVPFDRSNLERMIGQQSETSVAIQTSMQLAWLQLVSEMSDEQRAAYAYAVEEAIRRGPKKRK